MIAITARTQRGIMAMRCHDKHRFRASSAYRRLVASLATAGGVEPRDGADTGRGALPMAMAMDSAPIAAISIDAHAPIGVPSNTSLARRAPVSPNPHALAAGKPASSQAPISLPGM